MHIPETWYTSQVVPSSMQTVKPGKRWFLAANLGRDWKLIHAPNRRLAHWRCWSTSMFKHVLIHLICWKTTGNAGNELEHQRWTRNEMQDGTDRVRGSTGSTGKLECKDSKPKQWMVRIDGWKFSWNIRSLFQGHQSLWSWCFCGHQSTAQLVRMQHRTQNN